MAALSWILTLFCVARCHLSLASPVLHSAQVVQVGGNASLTCNLTSSTEITWYLLRSDQLLPLLTVTQSKLGGHSVDGDAAHRSRLNAQGDVGKGPVSLEIVQVEKEDAGLYFCTGRCAGAVCVNRGINLTVTGAGVESARDKMKQPCWSLGICVLPGLLTLGLMFLITLYLYAGKPAVCCCNSVRRDSTLRVTEDGSLHYSSLKHADKHRPSGRGGTGSGEDNVIYSTVSNRKNPNASHNPGSE